MRKRPKPHDLWDAIDPPLVLVIDGVQYRVPPMLEIGHSFFLPVLDGKRVMVTVRAHYQPQGYIFVWDEREESGLLGIRVWRVA